MRRSLLLLMLLLAGCATAPVEVQRPLQLDAPFVFNGRFSIKQDKRRDNAGVRWVHSEEADEILLLAPLGKTVARIHRDEQHATLDDASGRRYVSTDMESLMQQVLGWQLPLSGLRYWVTALPAPDSPADIDRQANGQVSLLRQDGWAISYLRYAGNAPDALPLRLKLQRDGVEVLLLIDEWKEQ